MNSQLKKQLLIGVLAGVLVSALIWVALSGKRTELEGLKATNVALKKDVDKGYALKANYEKLKVEVAQQQKMIDELIKIMPTEVDCGALPYRVKKLGDTAGIEQISFKVEPVSKKDYYTENPITFTFRTGYHGFGQFASMVSGNDKIITLSEIQMKREAGGSKAGYPAVVTCRISAYVYNPDPPKPAAPAPGAAPAPAPKAKGEGGD